MTDHNNQVNDKLQPQEENEQAREQTAALAPDLEAEKAEIYARQEKTLSSFNDAESLREDKPIHQQSRVKIILSILIMCVVGVAVFFIAQLLAPSPEDEDQNIVQVEDTSKIFSNRLKTAVSKVEVTFNGTTLAFSMDENDYITYDADPEYPLDQTNIGSLFYQMGTMRADSTVAYDHSNLAAYGLDNPQAVANVVYDDGETATYYLGSRTPVGTSYYFMVEGDEGVYTCFTSVYTYLSKTLADYREGALLDTIEIENMRSVIINNGKEEINMRPYNDDDVYLSVIGWKMLSPYDVDVDTEELDQFLETISGITLGSYVDTTEELSKYGLENPKGRLYLLDGSGNEIEIFIGDAANSSNYYVINAQMPNDVYLMSSTYVDAVLNSEAILYANTFASLINISYVDTIEIESESGTDVITIERAEQFDENGELKTLSNGQPDYAETFYLNGQLIEEDAFREVYKLIIGITMSGEVERDEAGEPIGIGDKIYTTTFTLNNGVGNYTVEYYQYKSLYATYSVNGGDCIFYVTKEQVQKVFDGIENLK